MMKRLLQLILKHFLILCLCRYPRAVSARNHRVKVEVAQGTLEGAVEVVLGRPIVTFFGVPFARPPVGNLRFKPPQEPIPWKGILLGDTPARACPQNRDDSIPGFRGTEMWNPNTPIAEDCLYLNIWTPVGARNASVLVWIFGGGFYSGSPSLEIYNGKAIAAKTGMVVVNVNYRVGLFGFLYLNHPDAPGNMGLLDQQMALKWIYANIEALGGAKDRVCLMGESAGAASVSAHLLAPGSRPLFSNAVLLSGSMNNLWASLSPESALANSKKLAKTVGCALTEDPSELMNCLIRVPTVELLSAFQKVGSTEFLKPVFVPISSDNNFFKGDFRRMLNQGSFKSCNLLFGIVSDEGTFWMPYLSDLFSNTGESIINREQYLDSIRRIFGSSSKSPVIHNAVAFQYAQFSDTCPNTTGESTVYRDGVNGITTDRLFVCDLLEFAQTFSAKQKSTAKSFAYYFTARSSLNPWPKWMGVMHGYEIEFFFGAPLLSDAYSSEEKTFSRNLLKILSSFASTGSPSSIDWPDYRQNESYVLLDPKFPNEFPVRKQLKTNNCTFWGLIKQEITKETSEVSAKLTDDPMSVLSSAMRQSGICETKPLIFICIISYMLTLHCN